MTFLLLNVGALLIRERVALRWAMPVGLVRESSLMREGKEGVA
jgi:hypothetical protein